MWSAIESNIGIVCASLPHFKPLIDRFYPSLMGPGRGNSQMTPLHDQSKGSMPSEGKDNTLTSLQQEGQTGWKDSFAGDKNSNNQSCTTVTGGKLSNGNEENLRGGEIRHPPGRIYKSTSVVVSRH